MPLTYGDRVKETTASTGTGALALAGAVTGFRSFAAGIGTGNQTYYAVTDDALGAWEVGIGTLGVGTLTRDSVLSSSNANALVNFAAGTKEVFAVSPAAFFNGALLAADHAGLNHTGIPGVPAPEAFTAGVHAGTDHTGLPGVVPEAFTAGVHAGTDHTGLPGVPPPEAFTAGVHLTTDHSNALNAGVPLRQRLALPAGAPWGRIYPGPSPSATQADEALVPSIQFGGERGLLTLSYNDFNSSSNDSFQVVPGLGLTARFSVTAGSSRYAYTYAAITRTEVLPRFVAKLWARPSGGGSLVFQIGLASGAGNTNLTSVAEAIWFQYSGLTGSSWTVERRRASVSPASTPTAVTDGAPVYLVIDFTSATTAVVTIYDVATLAVLFTTTFTGTGVPQSGVDLRLVIHIPGATTNGLIDVADIILSHNL